MITAVDKEQGKEATVCTDSPKSDVRRFKKYCLVWWASNSAATFGHQGQPLA